MRKAVHPNEFLTEPKNSRSTRKAVQEMQPEHLKHSHVFAGKTKQFDHHVDNILESTGTSLYDKMQKAKYVDITFDRGLFPIV